MKKLIEIDTNGDNHYRYRDNLELFDIIAPMVYGFITDGREVLELDVLTTRKGLANSGSLHCVYDLGGDGYTSAAEITHLIIDYTSQPDCQYIYKLSELCDELAEKYNISSWKPKNKDE